MLQRDKREMKWETKTKLRNKIKAQEELLLILEQSIRNEKTISNMLRVQNEDLKEQYNNLMTLAYFKEITK